MSYAPISAGHDDAPLEREVVIEYSPALEVRIQGIVQVLQEEHRRNSNFFVEFLTTCKPWSLDEARAALCDPRVVYELTHGAFGSPKQPDLSHIMNFLGRTADNVVVFNDELPYEEPAGRSLAWFGDQSSRVFIFDRKEPVDIFFDEGTHTREPLVIYRNHFHDQIDLGFMNALVINDTDASWRLDAPTTFIDLHGRRDGKFVYASGFRMGARIVYIDATAGAAGYVGTRVEACPNDENFHKDAFPSFPKLEEYVTELVHHCSDPHSLHERYGPTPARTASAEMHRIINEYFSMHNIPQFTLAVDK